MQRWTNYLEKIYTVRQLGLHRVREDKKLSSKLVTSAVVLVVTGSISMPIRNRFHGNWPTVVK